MMTEQDVRALLTNLESDRIERTVIKPNKNATDKVSEAICAFSNDLPNHQKAGYFLFGVNNNGHLAGQRFGDAELRWAGGLRSDGNILPIPILSVEHFHFEEGDVLVIQVEPHDVPPVRYKGRTYIRVGARKAIASESEERILSERRSAAYRTFDTTPCLGSESQDLNWGLFKETYLPTAIDAKILADNHRDPVLQMASLGLYDLKKQTPTYASILLFGNNPIFYLHGAYIQYGEFAGENIASDPVSERRFSGDLITMLASLEGFLKNQIYAKLIPLGGLREQIVYDYPLAVLRELLLNAIMHRDYASNAPIRFYRFTDHIEIQNPGGLYGTVRPENFPNQNDYRNPIIAEALKNLGYVNRFNRGIARVKHELAENGNPEPYFIYDQPDYFSVSVFKRAI